MTLQINCQLQAIQPKSDWTYAIRFSRKMEATALELAEVFEEYGYESGDVLRSLFSGTLENEK